MDALGAEALEAGVRLSLPQLEQLAAHVDLLLKWNAKLNLTRITAPHELRIKHVLDALLGLPLVPPSASSVLDLGSGGGFPGVPWLIARPDLTLTMVDAVQKKVSFLKSAVAALKLARGRAVHVRLEGRPEAEGLVPADVVVSRAFTSLAEFLRVGRPYLAPAGCLVAYLGPREGLDDASAIAIAEGFRIDASRTLSLPGGLGARILVRAVPRGTA